MNKEQRAALRKLAEPVKGWSNCNQAWLDTSEDDPAAVVGHIDEDGNIYPVATIDCNQYNRGQGSLPLAKFYAAANPSTILQLLDYIEALEKDAAHKKITHGKLMAGYEVACRFGVFEKKAFDLAEQMFAAMQGETE